MSSVLIVMLDDNPDDLDIMGMAAEEAAGLAAVGAGSTLELAAHTEPEPALAALRDGAGTGRSLALLLDWHLPGDASPQLIATLRSMPAIDATYVLVNSGSDDPADRDAALAAGADGYSVKPAGFDASIALVAAVARSARPPGPVA